MKKSVISVVIATAILGTNSTIAAETSWTDKLEIAGLVEVELGSVSTDGGADESSVTAATVELGISSSINDWTSTEIVLLYEDSGDTPLDVDSATISLANPDSNWSLSVGRTAIPFGIFDTNLVSDPLTLELGETFEDIVMYSIEQNGFSAGAYFFNGDIDETDDEIKSFGAFVSYAMEQESSAFSASLGYINNIGDTDGISAVNDATGSIAEHVAGLSVSINYSTGPFGLIAEYLGASDDFAANTLATTSVAAAPSATNIEAAYSFDLSGKDATVALAVQGSDEASDIGLPENKTLVALSVDLMDNTSLAFELASEEDYAGIETDSITAQLAVEF